MNQTQSTSYEKTLKEKTFSNTVVERKREWLPNDKVGCYFGKFLHLTPRNDLNPWEILRVKHMIQRSYARQPEFLNKRDMCPSNSVGRLFDEQAKQNMNLTSLSKLGRTIMDKFIEKNDKEETQLRKKERQIWDYRHSKPPLEINPWKFSNHIIKDFSIPPFDKAHSFIKAKPKLFLIQSPFRIPKNEGDYFSPFV